jgi:hypothetical protein
MGGGAAKGFARGLFGSERPLQYRLAKIANLLQSLSGGTREFIELRKKKIEERRGKFEGIGNVAACVVEDGFLMPRVELAGIEGVGFREKDLRRRNDDTDHSAVGRVNGPNGNRVIGIRPKEAYALNAGALGEKSEESREFVALSRGRFLRE